MKIALDVDDVLADLLTAWVTKLSKMYQPENENWRWSPNDLTQWEFANDLGLTEEQVMSALTDDLYNDVLPHSGALSVVNALRARGHDPVYISTCYQQTVWPWKVEWLSRYGFMTAKDQAFPVGPWAEFKTKGEVSCRHGIRLLVDDSVKNCKEWQSAGGHALLLTRPHNKNQIFNGKRLRKFEDLLLEVKGMEYQTVHSPVMPASPFVGMPVDRSQKPEIWIDERIIAEAALEVGTVTLEIQPGWPEPVGLKYEQEPEKTDSFLKPTNPKDAVAMNKVPLHFVSGIVKAYQALAHFLGNVKYGAWNYRAGGARASVYVSALGRHVDKWVEGEKYDPIDGTPHLANAQACLNILIEAEETGVLVDDRPPSRIEALNRVYAEVESIMPKISERYADRSPRHYTINDTEVL